LYAEGKVVKRDPAEAVRMYYKAADQGLAIAQNALGVAYATGDGAKASEAEAVRWFRRAAQQGHLDAQYNLGLAFANGEGVAQDYVQAYLWWDLAASQGSSDARQGQNAIIQYMTRQQVTDAQRRARDFQSQPETTDNQPE